MGVNPIHPSWSCESAGKVLNRLRHTFYMRQLWSQTSYGDGQLHRVPIDRLIRCLCWLPVIGRIVPSFPLPASYWKAFKPSCISLHTVSCLVDLDSKDHRCASSCLVIFLSQVMTSLSDDELQPVTRNGEEHLRRTRWQVLACETSTGWLTSFVYVCIRV